MNSAIILADFANALRRLDEALRSPATSDLMRAGCIQYYEFCFELAWKSIKTIAESAGLAGCESPKACVKHAFSSAWIDDEETWLAMLAARNRMAHTCNVHDAMEVFDALPRFLSELQHLHTTLTAAQTT